MCPVVHLGLGVELKTSCRCFLFDLELCKIRLKPFKVNVQPQPHCTRFKTQNFSFLSRLIRLMEEIMSEKENKTIVFVETKRRCDELTRKMRRDGYVCFC